MDMFANPNRNQYVIGLNSPHHFFDSDQIKEAIVFLNILENISDHENVDPLQKLGVLVLGRLYKCHVDSKAFNV